MSVHLILQRIPFWAFYAFLVYMPFHIFLSQSLSLATGGLEVWKIAKDVLLAAVVLFTICLVYKRGAQRRLFNILCGLSVLYGLLFALLWLVNPAIETDSAVLGIVHNMRLPAFLLLGYGAALLNPGKFGFSLVVRVILGVSTVVAVLGVAQYFLPPDILTHIGYSLERGARPFFFIDDHPDLPRIMSTLREPNALGAYLLVPLAALTSLACHARATKRRLVLGGLLTIHLLAIFLTFSRSAWLALFVTVGLVLLFTFQQSVGRTLRRFWPVLVALLMVSLIGLFTLRGTDFVQNYIIHTSDVATGQYSSTELHYILAKEGFGAVLDNPAGYGPGTAGLASIQSSNGRLTENYFIQIMHEVGIVGFVVFASINSLVVVVLWRRRDAMSVVLLAGFVGYFVTNMLLHTWANEAVVAQWWLLAGLALAFPKRSNTDSLLKL